MLKSENILYKVIYCFKLNKRNVDVLCVSKLTKCVQLKSIGKVSLMLTTNSSFFFLWSGMMYGERLKSVEVN